MRFVVFTVCDLYYVWVMTPCSLIGG